MSRHDYVFIRVNPRRAYGNAMVERYRLSRVTIKDFAYDYYSGEPLAALADAHDVSTGWFSRLLKRHKLPVRPKNFTHFPHIRDHWLSEPVIEALRTRFRPKHLQA